MGKFAKSLPGKDTDKDGNFIFDVEASNENLDLEGERTLQRALIGTKNYFLTNGVISKDHLHQEVIPKERGGGIQYHEQYVIGEPLEVYTDGNSTRVRGKLYKSNPFAIEFMRLLRDGSTRVKASVGGLIPQRVKNKDGTKTVTSVLWNDLALTIAPVNPTVAPATITKSMTSAEFIKSLSAGYGTDSGTFSGGRALQKEEVGHETVNVTNEEAIASLVGAIGDGAVKDLESAVKFLNGYGYSGTAAQKIIGAVVENHKEFSEVLPMAKNLWDAATERLRKALGAPGENGEDDPDENGQGAEGQEGGDEGEDVQDATPVLKALSEHIEKLEQTNETIAKALTSLMEQSEQTATLQKSIGESLMMVMQGQQSLAVTPQPRKSAVTALEAAMLAKAGLGGLTQGAAAASGAVRLKGFTPADLDEAKDILSKAMTDGKLTLMEVTRAESQLNKCLNNPAAMIDAKFANILRGGAQ
jgi:hypothetical protein